MEVEKLFIYSTNNKNKILGKLENISKKEKLKNIRAKIKKMNKDDEFVKPTNNNNIDIFDKDMEEDFSLEDILIEENELFKIYIKESDEMAISTDKILKNMKKNNLFSNEYIIQNNKTNNNNKYN